MSDILRNILGVIVGILGTEAIILAFLFIVAVIKEEWGR